MVLVSVLLALEIAALAAFAPVVHAAPGDLECHFHQFLYLKGDPLKPNETQDVPTAGVLNKCHSPNGVYSNIKTSMYNTGGTATAGADGCQYPSIVPRPGHMVITLSQDKLEHCNFTIVHTGGKGQTITFDQDCLLRGQTLEVTNATVTVNSNCDKKGLKRWAMEGQMATT